MTSETQAPCGHALHEEGNAALERGELKLARETFLRGALLGHAGAQYNIGAMCYAGEGGRRDVAAAVEWFRKAADQGHEEAQANLLGMHLMGLVKLPNPGELVPAVLGAADRGSAFAQYNAGELYASDEVVPADLVEAYKWFMLTTAQGFVAALARLTQIGLMLSPEQHEVARQRISEFRHRAV